MLKRHGGAEGEVAGDQPARAAGDMATDLGRSGAGPRGRSMRMPTGLAEYLLLCEREGVGPVAANRAHVAVLVRELTSRPHHRGANVVAIDSGQG